MNDTFVTDADLSASRRPPNRKTGIREFLQDALTLRILAILYVLVIAGAWGPINQQLTLKDNRSEGIVLGVMAALPFAIIVLYNAERIRETKKIPIYRNIVFLRDFGQVLFLLAVVAAIYTIVQNLQDNLADDNFSINLDVLGRNYKSEIEGPDPAKPPPQFVNEIDDLGQTLQATEVFLPDIFSGILTGIGNNLRKFAAWMQPQTNFRALITGLINTIRVVIFSLIFATILGILVGIGLLSSNWLVRNVSVVYVEIFRNTPLLVQLFLVYNSFRLVLPTNVREAHELPGPIYVSARGLNYPKILTTDSFEWFAIPLVIGFIIGLILRRRRLNYQEKTGQPANEFAWLFGAWVGFGVLGVVLANLIGGNSPLDTETPVLGRFNFEGGSAFTVEFFALFVGLVLYTVAFIADIVRAGIQSVPKGQREAARAHGLTGGQTMRLVILPQAMRLIIPPLTNQYLNLSKNSSLAIAIGYYDLYNVATIASNQDGQVVIFFACLLLTYLVLSLIISFFMNFVNRGLRLKTR